MPHLAIQYSSGLASEVDIDALCKALHQAMFETGVFPLAGIRVRAFAADAAAIADLHDLNEFADLVLRMGAGRSLQDKKRVGEHLMSVAGQMFESLLVRPHFALSLEIQEIDKELSWKINPIHARLQAQGS